MTDNQGKVHQGTHWVCRYSPGGNDSSKLAQNVQKAPACTQSFHSRSVSCLRGMVPTDDGSCACPPGTQWDGRACAEPPRAQSPARIPPVQPPVTRPVCPVDLPVGTPPDCCPANHHFDPTVNRPRGSCVADTATSTPPSKRVDTQQSTSRPPPSCPAGTHFEHTLKHRAGACVTNTGTGGATTSKGADTQPNTPRPPATPCPAGTRFGRTLRHPRGACVTDTGTRRRHDQQGLSRRHAFRAHSNTPRGCLRVRHGQRQHSGPDAEADTYSDSEPSTYSASDADSIAQVYRRTHRHAAELLLSAAHQTHGRPVQVHSQTYAHAHRTGAAPDVPPRHQAAELLTDR